VERCKDGAKQGYSKRHLIKNENIPKLKQEKHFVACDCFAVSVSLLASLSTLQCAKGIASKNATQAQ